ncbi:MAG: ATP-dependent 6-phosphofructokinase [Actinomycetota bacterium]|nr:6-phosphofructokinase [Actinomycetota bacterium]MCL6093150.1 6-phosphofructokinase [Actinomycetota bacterium]MDA8167627.1 ATP-dependent 6-phosphofructokinase [Actinomycetota bacterium]
MAKKVAILTGGGDCPGLNAVIRAATLKLVRAGYEMVGVRHGWRGLLENEYMPLDIESTADILPKGGTILRTSRTNPMKQEGGVELIIDNLQKNDIWATIAIGGDDTLGVANKLHAEHSLNMVGVPKTIDNDLSGTDYTFGFDTAVQIATDCIDRLNTTAESHDRAIVVEIMGRHTGWITVMAGIAGGADVVMLPEFDISVTEVCDILKRQRAGGKNFNIVAVSEGAKLVTREGEEKMVVQSDEVDAFGNVKLGGVAELLAKEIERRTGFETRATVLGHIQRGGTPTARDRILATRYGARAADMVIAGDWGNMAALQGDEIVPVPLSVAVGERKLVRPEYWDLARTFFA